MVSHSDLEGLPSALASQRLWCALAGKRPFVFLDYDGTLTPIVERPELAVLSETTRSVLLRLARLLPTAIVSGRDRIDVEGLVGLPDLIYVGGHGWDVSPRYAPLFTRRPMPMETRIAQISQQLVDALAQVPGVEVEHKRHSVVVHVRRADVDGEERAADVVEELVSSDSRLYVSCGKKVLEVLPRADWNKGSAVLALLGDSDRFPIYLGDDRTDEDAFTAIRRRGLGILVSEGFRPSAARYRLRDPEEVRQFLERLIREFG